MGYINFPILVFAVQKLRMHERLKNPNVIVVVDRIEKMVEAKRTGSKPQLKCDSSIRKTQIALRIRHWDVQCVKANAENLHVPKGMDNCNKPSSF